MNIIKITCLLILSISAILLTSPGKPHAALPGDTNADGVVNISEVQKTINAFLGLVYDNSNPVIITLGAIMYMQPASFEVSGTGLDLGITATASGACSSLTEQAGGTTTRRTYTCTPSAIGTLTVVVSNATEGTILSQVTVNVPNPEVSFTTSMGTIVVKLHPDKAPITVNNFLQYVRDGFYASTIFHRVVNGFVIQGGGYNTSGIAKVPRPAIKLESAYVTGLTNVQGTIAMARSASLTSATSQFYINTVNNNPNTDSPNPGTVGVNLDKPDGQGYAVFGTVIQGLDVVKEIEAVPVNNTTDYKPASNIVITSATQTR